ncbi:RND efflux system, outer membrane lipoprotein, NodT family [Nitrosomonas sp. Is79A3]|uniref:efflux transporter outer membrane subunit n=1 Tax=Nitrosomonas sp. (strain Is79A3) TaxID=261292 RepID=UPI000215C776
MKVYFRYITVFLMFGFLTGCMVGPDYKRPEVDLPLKWRVDTNNDVETVNTTWWEQFNDATLNELIQIALRENKELRIAALRVEEFNARLQIVESALFPQLGIGSSLTGNKLSENRQFAPPHDRASLRETYEFGAVVNWELDLWGRIRRSREAATAEVLSDKENYQAVMLKLVADVASAYMQLLSLDRDLEITKELLKNREKIVQLNELKFSNGAISKYELDQIYLIYEKAKSNIPIKERQIAHLENALSVLLGQNPGPISRRNTLETLTIPAVPQGIPSEILARRPDVRQAEQDLIAANARIGVAKAQYFPTISLTNLFGYASTELSTLLLHKSNYYTFGATTLFPIFTAGRIAGQVRQNEAVQQQTLSKYLRTIQTVFQEVEDALISNQKLKEQFDIQARQLEILQGIHHLELRRFDGGYSSYIDVLNTEQNLYNAEITQVQNRRDICVALIQVYKTMGGGWLISEDEKVNTDISLREKL